MNIALISPSPKPFNVGGIEKLMLGLYSKIDELTDNKVELIKLPTEENGFWELLGSYEQFYNLDLDHFDMVITLKYPAWMVQHKNHVLYMAHHLRGLFDTYHFLNLPDHQERSKYKEVNDILDYIGNEKNLKKRDLHAFFALIKELKIRKNSIPESYFTFPGPFIKDIIQFLDKWALDEKRISRYTSISETVKKRKDYFPTNVSVDVIYPPTTMANLEEGSFDYFLVVGRLDGPKRVDMIVEAVKHIKGTDLKLLIAGSGPEEVKLKKLAGDDPRIEFLGYINNIELVNLYKDALAIIYIPYDEDYGLVTVEAMKCGKPVITCSDSGGTTAFVIHEKTGLIARPNHPDLAAQIKRFAENKAQAIKMGTTAKNSIQRINWAQCISELVNVETANTVSQPPKKKMTVLSTYPIFPKKHGGQLRIYNLYKHLSESYDITILSFNDQNHSYRKSDGNLKEISIPKSSTHQEKEWNIEKEIGIPITDIVMEQLVNHTPAYIEEAGRLFNSSDILVACQPYLFSLIEPYEGKKTLIHDSQNVEYNLKTSMLPKNKYSKKLLQSLFELEKRACQKSDLLITCSEQDSEIMVDLYDIDSSKPKLVSNGVDTYENKFVSIQQRMANKASMNIEQEKIVTFIGSWHKPNLEAVEEIFKFAPAVPEVKFLIMGGQCLAFEGRQIPDNVSLVGMVEEDFKNLIYSVADIAINPMVTGSGTNLKIAEYLSKGIPVITTEVGGRGYPLINGKNAIISLIGDFPKCIKKLIKDDSIRQVISITGREVVEGSFSWKKLADIYNTRLEEILILEK